MCMVCVLQWPGILLQFSSKAKPLVRGTAICDDSVPTSVLPEVKVITTPAPDSDDSPCDYNGQPPLLGQVMHLPYINVMHNKVKMRSFFLVCMCVCVVVFFGGVDFGGG